MLKNLKNGMLTTILVTSVILGGSIGFVAYASIYVAGPDSCVASDGKIVYIEAVTLGTAGSEDDAYTDTGVFYFGDYGGGGNTAIIGDDGLRLRTVAGGEIVAQIGIPRGMTCEPLLEYTKISGSGVGVNLYDDDPNASPEWLKISHNNDASAPYWTVNADDSIHPDWNTIDQSYTERLSVAGFTLGSNGSATVKSFTIGDTKYVFGAPPADTDSDISPPAINSPTTETTKTLLPPNAGML